VHDYFPVNEPFLRLLFNRSSRVRDAVCSSIAGTPALRLGRSRLCFLAFVIIVFVNVHMTSSWLVVFRAFRAFDTLSPFLLWCLRHTGQRWLGSHRWQRWWVVSSLRWVVAVIEAPRIRSGLGAVTRYLGRRHTVRGRGTTAVWLLQFLTLLVIGWRLWVYMVVLLPLAVPFGGSGEWAVITVPRRCFSCSQCRCWRRRTASNTATGRRIRVVLVRSLVSIAWRASPVLHNGAHLWWRAARTSVWGQRTLGLG
jgi:hypothetical protein